MPFRRSARPVFRRRRISLVSRRRSAGARRPRVRRGARSRRSYARSSRSFGPRWTNPVPQTSYLRFRYADDAFAISTTALGSYQTEHVFRGNSVYDPDYTGVGVQPYGYDQWVAVLGGDTSYKVWASSIAVNYTVLTSPVRDVKVFVVPLRDATLAVSDVSDLRQMPKVRWKATDTAGGKSSKNWITNYCSTSFLFRHATSKDWDFGASYNANPPIPWYWHVYFDTTGSEEEVDLVFDVRITYYVTMTRASPQDES